MTEPEAPPTDFVRDIVRGDVADEKNDGKVATRFPPEPNGYLHIGHAKAICVDFGIAREFGGTCNLRFDDTNPTKESTEYVDAIKEDVRWLGFEWDGEFFASDYFEQLYEWAVHLVREGKAYVDDLPLEEVRRMRGSLTEPGEPSPHRDRSVEENLDLFARMRAGEFANGEKTLRAKIDMAAANTNLRDPVLYRILHSPHHRTGDTWCIYPMYDWAHGQSDAIEGITHSICTLEFEIHRPLYEWFLEQLKPLGVAQPRQIEFARLNLTYTMMSKRRLLELVEGGHVAGWDDPRMPTLGGLRRRGYTPESITRFATDLGVTKFNSTTDMVVLENALRNHLNKVAPRFMAVLRPLKVVVTNYPEGESEELEAVNNPEDESAGTRTVPFSRVLYIERDDFMEDAPRKFFRLSVGREVRLRYAYFVTCTDVVKDESGEIVELHCTYDPATRGGDAPDGRKVKGTLHWVSAEHAVPAEVRLYDHLFATENPAAEEDWLEHLNPTSLEVVEDAMLEPNLAGQEPGFRCQFERLGYFAVDPDTTDEKPVFNRAVTLRDSWAKAKKKGG